MDVIIADAPSEGQPPSSARNKEGRLTGLRLAVLAGVLLWLACPPVTLWPLAWVAVAPLILSVTRARSFRQAAWRGYLFGWVYLGAAWYWVGLTIVAWTESPIGWLAWFGLTLILAGFYAAWGGAAWWLSRRTSGGAQLTALAATWVVMEWARTIGSLTMPWAQLSYTQYRFLPILQIADFTGAYGVSFLMMLVNGAVAFWWMHRRQYGSSRWLWATLMLTGFVCLYGWARLLQPASGRPLSVAAMQGNFKMRESAEDVLPILETFTTLTRQAEALPNPPTLTVWSESAAPGDALNDPATRQALTDLSRKYPLALIVGSRIVDPTTNAEWNSSVLFPPDGGSPSRYDKRQLVPFGEFIPFRGELPPIFDQTFHFFDTDVTLGAGPTLLRYTDPRAGAVALGPFICYESMYPHYAREMTAGGANLLITQSNDAWFQSEAAMEQHLAAVVLRAVENRRDIVRATTNGVTCLLDSDGRVTARAPLRQVAFVAGTVRLRHGLTPYVRFGDWFVLVCAGLVGTLGGLRRRNKGR